MQSIKEHNLKANHNTVTVWLASHPSVCNLSKNIPLVSGKSKSQQLTNINFL